MPRSNSANAQHLERGFSGRRAGVDRLLVQIELAPGAVQFGKEADEILKAAAKTIN